MIISLPPSLEAPAHAPVTRDNCDDSIDSGGSHRTSAPEHIGTPGAPVASTDHRLPSPTLSPAIPSTPDDPAAPVGPSGTVEPRSSDALPARKRRLNPRRKARGPLPPEKRTAAALEASGAVSDDAIAATVQRSPDTVSRWRHDPRYLAEVERQRAAREAEDELVRARPIALRTLRVAAENGDLDAARALVQASQPASERQRHEARRAVLQSLPPALRRQVADALTSSEDAALRALSDDELEALIAGGAT